MTKRITALLLTLVTLLSLVAVPGNAASTLDEAMADVNVYARNNDLNWLRMNGSVKVQHYTYYRYRSELTGQTKEIPAYCTDPRLYGVPALVPEGTAIRYGADGTVTDPKIMGIVANGYPHMDLATLGLQTTEEAYYATKTALWCYLLSTWSIDGLSINPNADQAAAARVLQATRDIYTRGMWWEKLVSPKLTATPDRDTAYAATVNGERVYQQIFTVTSETWSIEPVVISLASGAPSGTKLLDMDNNPVSGLYCTDATYGDDGYTWQVKVVYPASAVEGEDGTVQLNLSSVVVQYELYHAKCLETDTYGNVQRYVLDTDPHIPITASAVSTYSAAAPSENPTPSSGETAIRIRKLESGTNTPLSGAVFEVKYPDGSTVGSFSTGNDGTITIPVTITGNYTVTETVAPANHLLPEARTQSVTVTHGNTATVTFVDAPYGNIRVEKHSDTGEALRGVTIQIKNIATGATQSAKTSSAGIALFTELPVGGYEVRETAGIEGWQLDGETVQTVAVTTGATSTVTFVNRELPGLRIVKYDRTTLQTMQGVTFEIFKDGTSIGRYTTDALGEIVFSNAAPGTYLVREVQSTDTHITTFTEQEIKLLAGDGIRQLVFFNDRKPGLHLVKVDSANLSKPIANARFSIRAVDGSYGPAEFTTGADGTIDLSLLPTGAYVVTELECPGYVIDNSQRIIQLDGNETAEFVFTNSIRPSIHIVKISSDGTPLAGVAFRIAKIEDGTSYLDRTTDANGEITINDLDPGVYSVREISTVADHVLDTREFHVELFAGRTSTLVVENQKRPNLIVYKFDSDTGEPIAGTVFTVRAADGHSVDEIRTDANGKASLSNLLPGVYEISEKSVPSDWLLDAPSELVTLYANRDHTAYFYNHKKPSITVRKVSSVTGDLLEGAKFHVEYASNNTTTGERNDLGYYYTGEDGTFTLTHQRDGWYRVQEVTPPTGYALDAEPQGFYLKAGTSKTITFEDTPLSALIVFKYDSMTGEAVEGAVFQLRYLTDTSGTGGTVIGRYVTSANGSFTVTNLTKGTYIIEELASDGNHVIDSSPQTAFLSGNDQDVVSVYFGNAPKGSLLVRKIDSATHEPLSDVRFYITDSSGSVVGNSNGYFVTDSAGTILIDGIDPGVTLIARETAAKDGYVLDDVPQAAYIKAGQTVSLEFRNAPKGGLIIQKRDSITGAPLGGAVFRVVTSDGRYADNYGGYTSSNGLYTTAADGQIQLYDLTPGTYVVTEERAPAGYVLNSQPQTVVVNTADTQILTFDNPPKGALIVQKYDSVTKEPLAGAQFRVTTSNGELVSDNEGLTSSVGIYTTNEQGQIVLRRLNPDTYVVTEVKAPDNYKPDATPQTVRVNAADTQTVSFTNTPLCTLTIHKRDSVTKEPLAKTEFSVAYSNGETIGTDNGRYITGTDGSVIVSGLKPDATVVVSEVKAPTGYIKDTTLKTIVVRSGAANSVTFDNEPTSTLIIRKCVDGTKYEPVSRVGFRVVDGSGAGVGPDGGTYYTDNAGEIVLTGLEPGTTVTAYEFKTVDGMLLDGTPQTIQIKSGEVQHLTFFDQKLGTLVLKKLSSADKKTPLEGVEFLLTYADGSYVDNADGHLSSNGIYFTDSNGEIRVSGVVGTIVATEQKSIDGYSLGSDRTQTVVVHPNDTQTLYFYNDPYQTVVIQKYIDGTTKPLAGVTFLLTDGNGNKIGNGEYKTDANGRITLSVPSGTTIIARETRTVAGYVLNSTPQTIVVGKGGTQTVTMTSGATVVSRGDGSAANQLTFYDAAIGKLELVKVDAANKGKRLEDATFEIRKMDQGVVTTVTTGRNGRAVVELDAGSYYVIETEAPEGYKLETTPTYFTIEDGKTTTVTVKNKAVSGIRIHKTDAVTGEGIYGAKFIVYNAKDNTVGEITTNDRGYAYIEVEAGCYRLRELECEGYVVDTQRKDVEVESGGTTLVEWKNTPVSGQIMVYKYAGAFNTVTGTVPGTPLSGAVYEIVDVRTGKVVDNIATDARGVAASKPLPLKRYQVREVSAPAYWQVDNTVYDVTLEFAGQIIKLSCYDKPAQLGVSITKRANKSVLAGQQMMYTVTVANTSNVALDNFFWHDRLPTDVSVGTVLTTGTYNARFNYRVLYKTSYSSDYQVLASNLLTSNNYSFALNAIPLQRGEVVTDVYFDFGKVPVGFQSMTAPTLSVQVHGNTLNGYNMVNRADAGGMYNGTWQTSNASWATAVCNLTPVKPKVLPKTGY